MVYQHGPKTLAPLQSRPLTRVMARARSLSDGAKTTLSDANYSVEHSAQSAKMDAYLMEVNEYKNKPGNPINGLMGRSVPCVTVRDLWNFIPDKKQRRIWVPVAVSEELSKALKSCRVNEEEGGKIKHDVLQLQAQSFICPITKKVIEIEKTNESTINLRTYMDVPSKEDYQPGDFIEVINLRNELIGRLIKFLDDVATRYRRISQQMTIPSLYSYSGERRFYYDLRETRWGLRLHISQVTDLHRNVIGIPLEAVVAFRDRLNQAIEFLGLEDPQQPPAPQQSGGKSLSGNKSKLSRRTGRRRTGSGQNKQAAASASSAADTTSAAPAEVSTELGSGGDASAVTDADKAEEIDEEEEEEGEDELLNEEEEKLAMQVDNFGGSNDYDSGEMLNESESSSSDVANEAIAHSFGEQVTLNGN